MVGYVFLRMHTSHCVHNCSHRLRSLLRKEVQPSMMLDEISRVSNQTNQGMHREHRRALDFDVEQGAPIFGEFRELAYYYADVFVGTPSQKFTVITDTGSSRLAFPCKGCTQCGEHMNPPFDPLLSTTSSADASCGSQCTYSVSYQEGSSIAGVLYFDLVWLGGDADGSAAYGAQYGTTFRFGCHTRETSECQ